MKFWKYHGIGNDFVLLDGFDGSLTVDGELCKRLCNRNCGIGADGVLYVLPGEEGADLTMRIINADGSEAEMCGNGIRCVAKYALDFGLVKASRFTIHTGAGNLDATVTVKDGKAVAVRINMGAPILECARIPIKGEGKFIGKQLNVDGADITGTAVSMGNPHFVTFDEFTESELYKLGPALEKHEAFPNKTNVEFVTVKDDKLFIRVYERGAAWTLACGTGACASTVAAALAGLVPYNTPIEVNLPGGWLKITVNGNLEFVLMEGPAELVFEGNITV